MLLVVWCFFCFKQKTAYEMRISDWSSDVCSSDLLLEARAVGVAGEDVGVIARQRGDGERLAATARAEIDDGVARRGVQSGGGILARGVLHLEAAFGVSGMLDGGGFGREAPAVGGAGDRLALREEIGKIVAARLDPVGAEVDRKSTRLNSSH